MLTEGRTAIQFCRIPLIDVVAAIDQIAASFPNRIAIKHNAEELT
ncbi:hypothetical protein [Rhizobium gallicum]|nr:hypothetical protein [Rhizobium gallicum]